MAVTLTTNLDRMQAIVSQLNEGVLASFDDDQKTYIRVITKNLKELEAQNVLQLSLIGLSAKSHELRQLLTAIVGYCALLNSPKLSSHGTLIRDQLTAIHDLNDLARDLHWRLDGLIQFANQIVRPPNKSTPDMGMLNLGGYLRAQADHYVCRQYVDEINIPDNLPFVYANDTRTKLMLRGLFSIALDLVEKPHINVSAYTMRKFVRVRVSIDHTADQMDSLMKLLEVKTIRGLDARSTQAMLMKSGSITTTLVQLGMYTMTHLANQQGGRVKLTSSGDRLIFTLTMSAEVPETGKLRAV